MTVEYEKRECKACGETVWLLLPTIDQYADYYLEPGDQDFLDYCPGCGAYLMYDDDTVLPTGCVATKSSEPSINIWEQEDFDYSNPYGYGYSSWESYAATPTYSRLPTADTPRSIAVTPNTRRIQWISAP
jgi:hypothetical protein